MARKRSSAPVAFSRGELNALYNRDPGHDQRIFVSVLDPINPRVETPEEVRDRVLEAAEFIAPRLSDRLPLAAQERAGAGLGLAGTFP